VKVEAAVAAAVAALQRPAPLAENEKKNEATEDTIRIIYYTKFLVLFRIP
jgi:hypothetical protein